MVQSENPTNYEEMIMFCITCDLLWWWWWGRGRWGGGGRGAAQLSGLEPSWRSRSSGSSHCGSDSQSSQGEGPLSLTLSPTLVQSRQCPSYLHVHNMH